MKNLFCSLRGLLVAVVTITALVPATTGTVLAGDDGRTTITLTAPERNAVLSEMRVFLESVQAITAGLAEKDMNAIAASGRKSGMAAAQDVPQALRDKLPLAFKKLGMATHKGFDALAGEAQEIGDRQTMLTKLGGLLRNCTTCHASYRFEVERAK